MVGTTINERYEIQSELGQGGMGTVYLARDTQTNVPVAIKELKDRGGKTELLERFRREGEALRQLNHPNIVNLLDAFELHDQHYLVMEYVEGGDLENLLEERGKLDVEQILKIALELADALTRAHHLDIIHRDIKPANVLLAQDGTPRLADFGVAYYNQTTHLTQEGVILGTVPYLSPEGCQGKALEARSDIWSFGVLLYEMLTGELPFQGENIVGMIAAILNEPIPDLEALRPDALEGLVDLVYRMLAKTPDARIPSVRLVGAEIEGLLKGFEVTPSTPPIAKESIFKETPTKKKINLPQQAVRFVGREKELAEITDLLAKPEIRLLTLLGPGGMGKSRLAIETARRLAGEYAYGVGFVGLASLSAPEQIVSAIADAMGFQFSNRGSQGEQLKKYLANKNLLLILDNFEHLVESAGLITEWLDAAPELKIIVTSRTSLSIQAERIYEVSGMHAPTAETDIIFEEFDAVELFIAYARRTRPDYELSEEHKAPVVDICKLVGGMPLGIELAAGWIRTLPPDEIAEELAGDMDFLSSTLSDLPERQRSMRAVFDYSWKLLDETAQGVFMKLCLFPDGFTRPAAKAVAGASVRMLSTLTEQSLIQRDPTGRFRIHELMRQFGKEMLKTGDAQYETVMDTYWGYYADWLAALEPVIKNGGVVDVIKPVLDELENIAQGWQWGAGRGDFAGLEKAYYSLLEVAFIKSKLQLAHDLVQSVLTALAADAAAGAEFQHLRRALTVENIYLMDALRIKAYEQWRVEIEAMRDEIIAQKQLANIDHVQAILLTYMPEEQFMAEGKGWCEQVLARFEKNDQRYELGYLLDSIGLRYFWFYGDQQKGAEYFERSREINRQVNPVVFAQAGRLLGEYARFRGEFEQARTYYSEAIEIFRSLGDDAGVAFGSMRLGRNCYLMGEWEAAIEHLTEARQYLQELNEPSTYRLWLFVACDMEIMMGEFEAAGEKLREWDDFRQDSSSVDSDLGLFFQISGKHAFYQGAYDLSYEHFLAAEEFERKSEIDTNLDFLLPYLGRGALAVGRQNEAWAYFEEGLELTIEREFWPNVMQVLAGMATFLAERGQLEEAVELAAIPAIHRTTFYYERQLITAFLDELAEKLPSDIFEAAKARGESLTPEEVYQRYFGDGEIK